MDQNLTSEFDLTKIQTHSSRGCPVFYKDELIFFGVHTKWDTYWWDDVRISSVLILLALKNDFQVLKLKSSCKFESLPKLGYQFKDGSCHVFDDDVWLCFHDQDMGSTEQTGHFSVYMLNGTAFGFL